MIEINGKENGKPINVNIDWMYPEIYENHSTLTIGMCHVRATDDIRIKYDSDRNGWIIEQASETEDYDEDWQEVAFVESWGREK